MHKESVKGHYDKVTCKIMFSILKMEMLCVQLVIWCWMYKSCQVVKTLALIFQIYHTVYAFSNGHKNSGANVRRKHCD